MPCLDEEAHIAACLRGALAQDYPADRFEVLVVDGGSTDATRRIAAAVAASDPRVRLLDNPERYQAPGSTWDCALRTATSSFAWTFTASTAPTT